MNDNIKFKRQFNWSITKEQAEKYVGPLSNSEFDHFCKIFTELFYNEYDAILENLKEDWEEYKTWES